MAVARLLLSSVVALVVSVGTMAAIATFARPEPGPCHDTPVPKAVTPTSMCAAPQAPTSLVLGGGAAAGSAAFASAVVFTGRREHRRGWATRGSVTGR